MLCSDYLDSYIICRLNDYFASNFWAKLTITYNRMASESSKTGEHPQCERSSETSCRESSKEVGVKSSKTGEHPQCERLSETGYEESSKCVEVKESEEPLQVGEDSGSSRGEEEVPLKCKCRESE
jgi:hypothetical protein